MRTRGSNAKRLAETPKRGRPRKEKGRILLKTPSGKFADYLQSLLDDAGMSAEELADAVSTPDDTVSVQSVWKWLQGAHVPHLDRWPAIAAALNIRNLKNPKNPKKLKNISDLLPEIPVE